MAKNSRKQIRQDTEAVLRVMQEKGKNDLQKISEKAGFSRQKTWRMIKKLEENKGIWGYTAVINPELLNKKNYLLMMNIECDKDVYTKMANGKIESLLAEIGITVQDNYYTHGEYNWMLKISADDTRHLTVACNVIMNEFPDSLTDIETMEVMVPIKVHNIGNPKVKDEVKQFY